METIDRRPERVVRNLSARQVDANLIGLPKVAQVDSAKSTAAVCRNPFDFQMLERFRLQPPERSLERVRIEVVGALHQRRHVVGLEVDREQPKGGYIARIRWDY